MVKLRRMVGSLSRIWQPKRHITPTGLGQVLFAFLPVVIANCEIMPPKMFPATAAFAMAILVHSVQRFSADWRVCQFWVRLRSGCSGFCRRPSARPTRFAAHARLWGWPGATAGAAMAGWLAKVLVILGRNLL